MTVYPAYASTERGGVPAQSNARAAIADTEILGAPVIIKMQDIVEISTNPRAITRQQPLLIFQRPCPPLMLGPYLG